MNNKNRLKFLRITICLGLLAGIAFSREAWLPIYRSFPRAPFVLVLPENFVVPFEWLFSSILVVALILAIFSRRPKRFLLVAVCSLVSLCFFDQLRLQPWAYQYLLLLTVFYFHDWESVNEAAMNRTLGLAQILIAALYFWSGVQKLNFAFSHETLPALLAPAQNYFPAFQPPFVLLGASVALTELLIGCGLLFRKTRNLSVGLAVLMHASILTLLIAEDYNSVVWVWNAALAPLVVVAFWRSSDKVSVKQTLSVRKADGWKPKAAKLIAAASVLLPALSFFGWWDAYLSGALYSGNAPVAVMRIDEEVFEKLPETARRNVFRTKNGGEPMLPLFEWALADLNVPVYPERRVFKRAAREICETAGVESWVELIIKERPAIFDGSYKLTRISCARLDE